MFNKLPSRKTLPRAKEVGGLSSSENLLSRRKASQNTNPISSALTKSSVIKPTITSKNKTTTSMNIGTKATIEKPKTKIVQSLNTIQGQPKTPPRSTRQILGHRRSNSDGDTINNQNLSRTRSTSSLFNKPQPTTKQIDLVKEYELKCQQLFKSMKQVLPKKYNVYKLSYQNICWIMHKMGYVSMSSQQKFIDNKMDGQLGLLYKFWVNLTNTSSASLDNFMMLLLHIEGIAMKYHKIEVKVKDYVQKISKQQDPKTTIYAEPEYRFIGIQSISSWTNTGRLVVHLQESVQLQRQFSEMVNRRVQKTFKEQTTPVRKFYTQTGTQDLQLQQQCVVNISPQKQKQTPSKTTNIPNYHRKKVSIPSNNNLSSIEPKKVRLLKNKQQMQEQKLQFISKTQQTSKYLKTQPNLPTKQFRRAQRLHTQSPRFENIIPSSPKTPQQNKSTYRHRRVRSDEPPASPKISPITKIQKPQVQASNKRIPLIYIDINLDNCHKQTIAIFDDDKSQILASKFAEKHELDKQMQMKLKQLIDQQMGTILTKIQEQQSEQQENMSDE